MRRTRASLGAVRPLSLTWLGVTGALGLSGVALDVAPGQQGPRNYKGARPHVFMHGPTMAEEHGPHYLFSTGDPAGMIGNGSSRNRPYKDPERWTYQGTVFSETHRRITARLGDIPNLWAPDISYFNDLWHLYYAASTFASDQSIIALATTPPLDQKRPLSHWTDAGEAVSSTRGNDYNVRQPRRNLHDVGRRHGTAGQSRHDDRAAISVDLHPQDQVVPRVPFLGRYRRRYTLRADQTADLEGIRLADHRSSNGASADADQQRDVTAHV